MLCHKQDGPISAAGRQLVRFISEASLLAAAARKHQPWGDARPEVVQNKEAAPLTIVDDETQRVGGNARRRTARKLQVKNRRAIAL